MIIYLLVLNTITLTSTILFIKATLNRNCYYSFDPFLFLRFQSNNLILYKYCACKFFKEIFYL